MVSGTGGYSSPSGPLTGGRPAPVVTLRARAVRRSGVQFTRTFTGRATDERTNTMGKLTDYTGPPIRPRAERTRITVMAQPNTALLLNTGPGAEAHRLSYVALEQSDHDGAAACSGLLTTALEVAAQGDTREAGQLVAALAHLYRLHAQTEGVRV